MHRHFLDLDGLACHIVVLLLLGQFLLEIGVESADGPVLIETYIYFAVGEKKHKC